MKILDTIKTTTEDITKRHGIKCEVTVTHSFIELVTETRMEAAELQSAFDKVFGGVEDIVDLAEIDEKGFMLTVRF